MTRRWRVTVALAAALVVVAAVGVVLLHERRDGGCSPEPRVAGSDVPGVFTTGADPTAGDARLARLVDAARHWRLGKVVGALGFDYGHYLSLAALPAGLAAWTKDSPDVAFLDPGLRPRWGIAQDRGEHAWDLTDRTWYQLRLPAHAPMQLTARRLSDGATQWCAQVGSVATRYGGPLATAPLPPTGSSPGDVLVLAAARHGSVVTRLRGSGGQTAWKRSVSDRADGTALLPFGHVVVVGGRASYDLAGTGRDGLRALDPATGRTRWTWTGAGRLHVIGTDGPRLLLEEQERAELELVALDDRGRVRWRGRAPVGTLPDVTVQAGVLVARTPSALVGWAASSGQLAWKVPVPVRTQYLPYGFQLDAQPMLDARHLLLGGTTALISLDLRTGRRTAFPLPVHGIDTTYWPSQVVVTDRLLALVTNTGAVVLRRSVPTG